MTGVAKDYSRSGAKEAKWKIGSFVKNIDGFGQALPSFNLKGETKVNTVFGGTITVLILSLTVTYAILKCIQLLNRENPTINDYPIEEYFGVAETVNLNEIEFKFAFSYRNRETHSLVDDPRYVKYIVRKTGIRNGTEYEELLPFHKCTDDDYAGFYPPAKNSVDDVKEIRSDPTKNIFCLDEYPDDLVVGGDKAITEWT